jgi:hypothetical protein
MAIGESPSRVAGEKLRATDERPCGFWPGAIYNSSYRDRQDFRNLQIRHFLYFTKKERLAVVHRQTFDSLLQPFGN